MAYRITDEDKKRIRHMYAEEGMTLKAIAESIGKVSKQSIWYHVNKMGIKPPPDGEKEERLKAAKAYLGENPDSSIKDVSEHLDCSWDSARTLMVKLGAYEEPVPFMERVDAQQLVHLYVVEDQSLAELSERFGSVSELTISKALKELGVPLRPQGASTGDIREDWRRETLEKLAKRSKAYTNIT